MALPRTEQLRPQPQQEHMPSAMRLLLSRVGAPRALKRDALGMASLAPEIWRVVRIQAIVVSAGELLGLLLETTATPTSTTPTCTSECVPARRARPRRSRHAHARAGGRKTGPAAARGADLAAVVALVEHGVLELGGLLAGAGGVLLLEGGGGLALGLLGALGVGALAALDLFARVLLLLGALLPLELAPRLPQVVRPRRRVQVRLGAQPREPAALERRPHRGHGGRGRRCDHRRWRYDRRVAGGVRRFCHGGAVEAEVGSAGFGSIRDSCRWRRLPG